MAKPLANEQALFDRIRRENITVHPVVWELIRHYIGNDIHAVQMIAEVYVSGSDPVPIPIADGVKVLQRCEEAILFMKKLREAAVKEGAG
jgi:hypothetical protein